MTAPAAAAGLPFGLYQFQFAPVVDDDDDDDADDGVAFRIIFLRLATAFSPAETHSTPPRVPQSLVVVWMWMISPRQQKQKHFATGFRSGERYVLLCVLVDPFQPMHDWSFLIAVL